jgi:dihydroflavonol-4-reductase
VERACRPLGIAPPLHRRRMDFFVKSYAFAQDEVRRQIGHVPRVDLHTGMQRTAAWYREKGLL